MTEANKIKRQKMYRENAINSWKRKADGVYLWWEKERYSREYCYMQVLYFQDLKF